MLWGVEDIAPRRAELLDHRTADEVHLVVAVGHDDCERVWPALGEGSGGDVVNLLLTGRVRVEVRLRSCVTDERDLVCARLVDPERDRDLIAFTRLAAQV